VIQRNNPVATGGGGGGMNYSGMPNSLALKFDLYPVNDPANPSGANATGLYANGALDDLGVDTGLDFASGHQFRVNVSYDAATGTLTQTITDLTDTTVAPFTTTYTEAVGPGGAVPLNLTDILGGTQAYVGFAGATGGLNAEQQVSNFTLNGQAVPFTVTNQTPVAARITQVFVNGQGLTGQTSNNGVAFRNLAGVDNTYGYPVPAGANQTKAIPWSNGVNKIAIRFDQDVASQLGQSDLVVRGINTANYTVTGFSYDAATKTGVWTLSAPIVNDKVSLFLDDAQVSTLDGEWTTGQSYPSGNGTVGGDFSFRVNVQRGDANQDGSVNALDLGQLKSKLNRTATNPGTGASAYSPFADLNADGQINALDLGIAKARLNNRLPAGEPPVASLATGSPLAAASITRDLFGTQPIA
jgi:hypothetical protein